MEEQTSTSQTGEGGAGTSNATGAATSEPTKKEGGEPAAAPSNEPIKVPRRNADFWQNATEREKTRQARADFFKSKQKPKTEGGEGGEGAGIGVDDDDQPLTRRELQALLERNRLDTQEESEKRAMSQSDAIAISSFLADPKNEPFRKYEKTAREYAKEHPYYPIEGIFRDLAYNDALAEGAKRGAKADEKVNRAGVGGGAGEAGGQAPPAYNPNASSKEHAEFKKKLKSGKASFGTGE